MGYHVFVDESKARDFTLVAVRVDNRDVARLRRAMRTLLMRGQERIHFNSERDARRRLILSELARHRLGVLIVRSTIAEARGARAACLGALLLELRDLEPAHVVVELDESSSIDDVRALSNAIRTYGRTRSLSFELLPARQDPGLWVADAFAWVNNRGGDWTRRTAMHPTKRIRAN